MGTLNRAVRKPINKLNQDSRAVSVYQCPVSAYLTLGMESKGARSSLVGK